MAKKSIDESSDEFLKDTENWIDFGLSDHLESGKFDDWVEVGKEAARIADIEDGSPLEALLLAACAASWHGAIKWVAQHSGIDPKALAAADLERE